MYWKIHSLKGGFFIYPSFTPLLIISSKTFMSTSASLLRAKLAVWRSLVHS